MTETKKKKHIGIYIHHQNKDHWFRFKELLPHFCAKLTIFSSLDLRADIGEENTFKKLPLEKKECFKALAEYANDSGPELFYIDESVEVATFINLLGIPYVFARMKNGKENDLAYHLACDASVFNIAPYDNSIEEDWYKKTPYYDKTKYRFSKQDEIVKLVLQSIMI